LPKNWWQTIPNRGRLDDKCRHNRNWNSPGFWAFVSQSASGYFSISNRASRYPIAEADYGGTGNITLVRGMSNGSTSGGGRDEILLLADDFRYELLPILVLAMSTASVHQRCVARHWDDGPLGYPESA